MERHCRGRGARLVEGKRGGEKERAYESREVIEPHPTVSSFLLERRSERRDVRVVLEGESLEQGHRGFFLRGGEGRGELVRVGRDDFEWGDADEEEVGAVGFTGEWAAARRASVSVGGGRGVEKVEFTC
jgi:hypothetical protein